MCRQKVMLSQGITGQTFPSHYTLTNAPKSTNYLCKIPQIQSTRTWESQIRFSARKSQGAQTQPTLDHSKLIVNLSRKHLTQLEKVLIICSCPQKHSFSGTSLQQQKLQHMHSFSEHPRTEITEVSRKDKPSKPNMSSNAAQRIAVHVCSNAPNIFIVQHARAIVMDRHAGIQNQASVPSQPVHGEPGGDSYA